jgi:hypothetical protein
MQHVVKSHLLAHFSDNFTKSDFRINWRCPYCDTDRTMYDKQDAIAEFKTHLYEHVEGSVTDSAHIAEQLSWNGNIQVKGPTGSRGADSVRTHFHSSADLAILITSNPEARIRLLHEQLTEWPSRTIVLSTGDHPFDEASELDFSGISIELVELDSRLGPTDLGETISRILDIHGGPEMTVSVEVSILREIIQSFDLETSCEFVRMLSARMEDVDGVFQLYVDPESDPNVATALNLLEEEIDFTVDAEDGRIVRAK